MSKDVFINGPVIVSRLQKKGKIIYLFGDFHELHTRCPDYNSIDIDKYFYQHLKINKSLDFFIETPKEFTNYSPNIAFYDYLRKVRTLYSLATKKNKLVSSYGNKRFHYFDNLNQIKPLKIDMTYPFKINTIINIKKNFEMYDKVFDKSNEYIKKITKTNDKKLKLFLQKHLNLYSELFNKHKNKILLKTNKIINKFKEKKYIESVLKNDIESLNDLLNGLFYISRRVIDLYLVRRILDKDYVKTAIVYSGIFHTLHLIYLFQKLGFEITHTTHKIPKYNLIKNMNSKYKKKINKIIFGYSPLVYGYTQCVNLKDFPLHFS